MRKIEVGCSVLFAWMADYCCKLWRHCEYKYLVMRIRVGLPQDAYFLPSSQRTARCSVDEKVVGVSSRVEELIDMCFEPLLLMGMFRHFVCLLVW